MTVSSQLPSQPPDDARDIATGWSSRRETSTGALSVSVIIAAYAEDRWHEIVKAVASALCQSPPPLEVILVIDHNPGLAQRARAKWRRVRRVTILENLGPKGASGARNTGVLNSQGEIVVFLDDDAFAAPDWLRFLCRHFSDAKVVGVGGGITPQWPGTRPRWFPEEFDWVVGGSYAGMPKVAAPIRNVWTGSMAVRRSAFDAVGGFRPGFGRTGTAYGPEDTDLCLRVRRALPSGYWLYEPSAEVIHKVPSARSTPGFFLKRCWYEGRGKADLARLAGINASTAAERRHATQVLPAAFLRELRLAIVNADLANLERTAAIFAGLLWTAAGFLTEMLIGKRDSVSARDSKASDPATSGVLAASVGSPNALMASSTDDGRESFHPVCVAQWDILHPFPTIQLEEFGDQGRAQVHLLVRMGTEPLGYADFEVEDTDSLPSAAAAAALSFRSKINARLAESGLPLISEIPVVGLQLDPNQLAFVAEREQLLENAPEISVVLCTRDRPARLAECVRQLARQEYPSYEIVVVDNAPADLEAVPAALKSLDVSVPLRYVLEPRGGLSWARNTGWRTARADIIAFLDDDVVPDEHWLSEFVRGFSARPSVGCVTGPVLPAELRTQTQLWFEEFGGLSKGRGLKREIFDSEHSQNPLYPLPPFGAGASMAFRREVLIDIEGFHVAMGVGTPAMATEDTFAFTRMLLAGHTMVYQPTVLIWHYHRETFADLEKQMLGYGTGVAAYYAALLFYQPKLLLSLLPLIPTAIKDMRGNDSVRTATMRTYPKSLLQTELRGMLQGVPAFFRSVIEQRRKGALYGAEIPAVWGRKSSKSRTSLGEN
jgi:GT2 family glycosyltransferase